MWNICNFLKKEGPEEKVASEAKGLETVDSHNALQVVVSVTNQETHTSLLCSEPYIIIWGSILLLQNGDFYPLIVMNPGLTYT